jgi:baseplate J-like protein
VAEQYKKEMILERMLNYTDSGYDKSAGGFIFDVEKPVSIELETYHTRLDNINDRHFADTSSGIYLDKYVADYGMKRKSATYATGEVTFFGSPGAKISIGDRVSDLSGTIFYTTDEGIIGDDGQCTVAIQCAGATSKGNVLARKITKMPITLKNITSVTNDKPTHGGSDTETDDELRERFYDRQEHSNIYGSASWYEDEAKSIDGVGDAKCIPLWNGGGTVRIIIVAADMQQADETLLERVRKHFENPIIGATITINSVDTLSINISVNIVINNDYNIENIKSEFENKVKEYLKTIDLDGGVIYIRKIGSLLMGIDGVEDYTELTLNNGSENITINADENKIPVLGVVTYG